MKQFIFLLSFAVLTTGCATRFLVPANRFVLPENTGALFKGDVKTGMASTGQVELADDVTAASPDTTPILSRNSAVHIGADLGLASFLDIYFTKISGGPTFAGLKIQLLGAPISTAKSGNFSLALAGGSGFGSITQNTEVGTIKGESELKFTGWEALLLLGYRPADSFLIYAGPFTSHIATDAKIKRTANAVTTTTAEPSGSGDFSGVNMGFRWGYHFFIVVEGSYINMKWTREKPTELKASDLSSFVSGITLGGAW